MASILLADCIRFFCSEAPMTELEQQRVKNLYTEIAKPTTNKGLGPLIMYRVHFRVPCFGVAG